MKFFLGATLLLLGLLPVACAPQSADNQFVAIYNLIELADHSAASGQREEALSAYADAQTQLKKLHQLYPDWNPVIVTYRLSYLTNCIAKLKNPVAPAAPPTKTPADAALEKLHAAVEQLTARLQSAQDENRTLQAKLEETLAVQPAAVDPAELARAQEQIRWLMKENDLLKSTRPQPEKLARPPATSGGSPAPAVLPAKLTDARAQIAELKAAAVARSLEKIALENRLAKLAKSRKPEAAALNEVVAQLRARLAVVEARPVPYAAEELALFRQSAPAPQNPEPGKRPITELPAGTAELVASAQRHFARHEFDQAEADYLKILERDPHNALALANLATIELQEDKLAEAEKHIVAASTQSPDDAYNLCTLGYLKFRQGKYDEALNLLSRAAQLDPNNPEIQNYLGLTLSHQGQRQAAETALRKAIQLNPGYAPAHNNLAVIYLSQEPPLPQLARWHYQKALDEGQPRNPDLEKMLADKGAAVAQ